MHAMNHTPVDGVYMLPVSVERGQFVDSSAQMQVTCCEGPEKRSTQWLVWLSLGQRRGLAREVGAMGHAGLVGGSMRAVHL